MLCLIPLKRAKKHENKRCFSSHPKYYHGHQAWKEWEKMTFSKEKIIQNGSRKESEDVTERIGENHLLVGGQVEDGPQGRVARNVTGRQHKSNDANNSHSYSDVIGSFNCVMPQSCTTICGIKRRGLDKMILQIGSEPFDLGGWSEER